MVGPIVQTKIRRIFSLMFLVKLSLKMEPQLTLTQPSTHVDFVAKFDYSDDQFAKVTFSELSEILKSFTFDKKFMWGMV